MENCSKCFSEILNWFSVCEINSDTHNEIIMLIVGLQPYVKKRDVYSYQFPIDNQYMNIVILSAFQADKHYE